MAKKKTVQELTVAIDLAEKLNAILGDLHESSVKAIERMREDGAETFRSNNYRQAILGLEYVAKYVRGFAGASATARIEPQIDEVLSSYSSVVARNVKDFAATVKSKSGNRKKKG